MYLEGNMKVSPRIVGAAIDVGLSAPGIWNVSAVGWLMGEGISNITSKIGVVGTVLGMASLGGMIAATWDAWDKKSECGCLNRRFV